MVIALAAHLEGEPRGAEDFGPLALGTQFSGCALVWSNANRQKPSLEIREFGGAEDFYLTLTLSRWERENAVHHAASSGIGITERPSGKSPSPGGRGPG